MADGEKRMYTLLYRMMKRPEDLPWHQRRPWAMLQKVVGGRAQAGRALDLGCGTGEFAVYLAQHGYRVTALDYLARPLQLSADLAHRNGVELQLVQADARTWATTGQFDLILDSGCLHGLDGADRATYREQVRRWLAPGGDFVLIHFGRAHALDRRPMGPRRRTRAEVLADLAPAFREHDYLEEIQTGVALPVGPKVLVGEYLLRHA
jgi:SAM-dependent methyltransferase